MSTEAGVLGEKGHKIEKKPRKLTLPRAIAASIALGALGLPAYQHHVENHVEVSPLGIASDAAGIPSTIGKDISWLFHRLGIVKTPDNKDVISDLLDNTKKNVQITSANIIKNAGELIDNSPDFDQNGIPRLIMPNPGENGSINITKKSAKDIGMIYTDPSDQKKFGNVEFIWTCDGVPADVPQELAHNGYVFAIRNNSDSNPSPDKPPAGYVEYFENPDGSFSRLMFGPLDTRFKSVVELPEFYPGVDYKVGKYMKGGTHIFDPKATLTVQYFLEKIPKDGGNREPLPVIPSILTDPITGQQGTPQR